MDIDEYIQIHTDTYKIHSDTSHTYTLLHVKVGDAPHGVVHDVCAIQDFTFPLVCSVCTPVCGRPFTTFPDKKSSTSAIQPVCNLQDLGLLLVRVFERMIHRLMEKVPWTLVLLAVLSTITAVGIRLRLIHEQACKYDARPSPDTISPLDNLAFISESIPSLE